MSASTQHHFKKSHPCPLVDYDSLGVRTERAPHVIDEGCFSGRGNLYTF
ncbi:MAG: hypothetical protein HQL69_24210 [Magnetococcales bacterium]|nr:hypothetical protein [Magnetococcales bacterium]